MTSGSPVTRWDRVRSARVVGPEALTEPLVAGGALGPPSVGPAEGEGSRACRLSGSCVWVNMHEQGAGSYGSEPVARAEVGCACGQGKACLALALPCLARVRAGGAGVTRVDLLLELQL